VGLFAIFHDAMREHDGEDPDHGLGGANLAAELRAAGRLDLSDTQATILAQACELHTSGATNADPTIGTCWDADRLDLIRPGVRPRPATSFHCRRLSRGWLNHEGCIVAWPGCQAEDKAAGGVVGLS
jgi:hypothetical protein